MMVEVIRRSGNRIDKGDRSVKVAVIEAALERGIRYFDTAPSYGDGASERVLGLGLREVRREVAICTKIGFPRPPEHSALAAARGAKRVVGRYLKTAKNAMVENFYQNFGFQKDYEWSNGDSTWSLAPAAYAPRPVFMDDSRVTF